MDYLIELARSNQFLSGGFILAIAATSAALGRRLLILGVQRSKLLLFCQCHFESENYTPLIWLMHWTSRQEKIKRARRVTIRATGEDETPELMPAPGRHFLRWRGRRLILDRVVNKDSSGPGHAGRTESWTVYLQGKRKHLDEFVAECRESYAKSTKNEIHLYLFSSGGWNHRLKSRRAMSTVILPEGLGEELLTEMRDFLDARDRYSKFGRPWRLGYLLEGDPGGGKTSFVLAVASELNLPVYMLNLSTIGDGMTAVHALLTIPNNAILLIEDMDRDLTDIAAMADAGLDLPDDSPRTAQPSAGPRDKPKAVSVQLLLQALDGLLASEGRLLFITTNHPERIDPALLRPGRIDRRVNFSPSLDQYVTMFRLFYPDEDVEEFRQLMAGQQPSLAALQSHFVAQMASWRLGLDALCPKPIATHKLNGHTERRKLAHTTEG